MSPEDLESERKYGHIVATLRYQAVMWNLFACGDRAREAEDVLDEQYDREQMTLRSPCTPR